MIDMAEAFHVGVRVSDLDAAMEQLAPALGVRWAEPKVRDDQPVWTPERGLERVSLRFCYSVDPPMHIELVEGSGGSVWDPGDAPGTHHIGVWVDDVDAEAERLVSLGWSLAACRSDPDVDGTHGIFAYLQPPTGLLVELVSREIQPYFEAWWAGD